MAKTKISEFSATPASNTDIDSINIGEGMLPSNVNNAIRELMSQLKDQQTGASLDDFTVGGNFAVTGTTTITGAETHTGAQTFNGAADFNSTANFDGAITATSTANLGSGVTIAGGTINNTTIGATTATTVRGTTVTATTGFTGNLTGNVSGNVTGNVTGNLTGNADTATSATTATTATSATTATTATNIAGGGANQVAYNTAVGTTGFLSAGTSGLVLTSNGSGTAPTWQAGVPSGSATNILGGAAGKVVYQTGSGTTDFTAVGTTGDILKSNATGAPTWLTTLPVANGGTGITSFGTGIATLLGTPSSANLASAITDETGTGSLVFGTTPTLTGIKETKTTTPAHNFDLSTANYFTYTLSGAQTLTVSNTATTGSVSTFILDITNGGSAVITWWSGTKWAAGTAPTLTTSGRDVLGFFTHDGGTTWNGLVLAKAMA
jgi:hypothetical protein